MCSICRGKKSEFGLPYTDERNNNNNNNDMKRPFSQERPKTGKLVFYAQSTGALISGRLRDLR